MFAVALTLIEAGVLGGFRRGWRKHYVEFLDASASALLVAMLEGGGEGPIAAIQSSVWEQVADTYQYALDDARERSYVDRLVGAVIAQLVECAAAERDEQTVRLTPLGGALATATIAIN